LSSQGAPGNWADIPSKRQDARRPQPHPVPPGSVSLTEGDLVRHEALYYRVEVKDLRRRAVAAAWRSWGQPEPGGTGEGGKQPRQRRDGSVLPDGPGPASKTGRCTRGTSVL